MDLTKGAIDEVAAAVDAATGRTLVVGIDQLEQLLDERYSRMQVGGALVRLRDFARERAVICVGTLRADFLAHFQVLAKTLELPFKVLPSSSAENTRAGQ